MKYLSVLIIVVATLGCSQSNSQNPYKQNASEIIELLIVEGIEEVYDRSYYLSPIFDTNFVAEDLSNMKQMLAIDDVDTDFMIEQHNTYKEEKIENFIGESYLSRISYTKPSIDEIYAVVDPPLFSRNFKKCIVYLTIIQHEEDSFKWDEKLFVFEKSNNWELTGHFSRE